jgi:Anti-sigma-28 factor, FlgM
MNSHAKGGDAGQGDPEPPTTPPPDRVNGLKQQVAMGRYRVDADAVAREMLRKLRLLSLTRRALLAERGGGTQAGPADP